MAYKFKLALEYDLEADNEGDAIYELVELLRREWINYADEGELSKVEEPIKSP